MPSSFLYHAAPLHYLPQIVADGALYAQSVLAARDIRPRATAMRRDRMLGLTDYVHLSFAAHTPLLADKVAKGYPHVLLVFDRAPILALPETALLPFNAKAWRTRAVCQPVTDADGKAHLLHLHAETHRFPSLEALVKYGLDFSALVQIACLTEAERALLLDLFGALALPAPPLETMPSLFPGHEAYRPTTLPSVAAYFDACRQAGAVLPPPSIPFD